MRAKKISGIIGLGKTGLSVARFLKARSMDFFFLDTRENPPGLEIIKKEFPDINYYLGDLNIAHLKKADRLIISPGVSIHHPEIQKAKNLGIDIIGDIELFAHYVKVPLVGITGSNGKTSVTTLLGEMAKSSGIKVGVGGNIGTPALDLLREDYDLIVLELSSFQLETTYSLNLDWALILNISEDHLDRYQTYQDYVEAKKRIYLNAKQIILNLDEPDYTKGLPLKKTKEIKTFSLKQEADAYIKDNYFIINQEPWFSSQDLKVLGEHHKLNFLVCFLLGTYLNYSKEKMIDLAKNFEGFPHRTQIVFKNNELTVINDSKATNIGATITALESLGQNKNIILIAGGDGKGADFSSLVPKVNSYCSDLILLGKDSNTIKKTFDNLNKNIVKKSSITQVNSLKEAIIHAKKKAKAGDIILLSPACSSLDMFKNYEDRGEQFTHLIKEVFAF